MFPNLDLKVVYCTSALITSRQSDSKVTAEKPICLARVAPRSRAHSSTTATVIGAKTRVATDPSTDPDESRMKIPSPNFFFRLHQAASVFILTVPKTGASQGFGAILAGGWFVWL